SCWVTCLLLRRHAHALATEFLDRGLVLLVVRGLLLGGGRLGRLRIVGQPMPVARIVGHGVVLVLGQRRIGTMAVLAHGNLLAPINPSAGRAFRRFSRGGRSPGAAWCAGRRRSCSPLRSGSARAGSESRNCCSPR